MDRRSFLRMLGVGAVGAAVGRGLAGEKGTGTADGAGPLFARRGRPNVLFFVADDLRRSVGAFGDPLARTPHIDALGARGTVFLNAHCQIAICNPSRASVMTGLRPDTLRVWGLARHFRKTRPDVVTLPQLFKQNGYTTQSIGKIYHGTGPASVDPPSWSDTPQYDHCTKRDQYPDGRDFVGVGVIPDVEVRPTVEDVVDDRDVVLARAMEILRAK